MQRINLCELPLEVESVLDRRSLDVRVQPVDLLLRKPALGKSAERLRFQTGVDDVG